MVEVLSFGSKGSMHRHLAEAINSRLHPMQRALDAGDYWVQFRDITDRDVRFGSILSDGDLRTILVEQSGMTAEVADATVVNIRNGYELGVYYGLRHDHRITGGVLDVVYLGRSWPIEERLFEAAREVGYNIDRLPDWGKVLLQAAFIACRYHARNPEAAGE